MQAVWGRMGSLEPPFAGLAGATRGEKGSLEPPFEGCRLQVCLAGSPPRVSVEPPPTKRHIPNEVSVAILAQIRAMPPRRSAALGLWPMLGFMSRARSSEEAPPVDRAPSPGIDSEQFHAENKDAESDVEMQTEEKQNESEVPEEQPSASSACHRYLLGEKEVEEHRFKAAFPVKTSSRPCVQMDLWGKSVDHETCKKYLELLPAKADQTPESEYNEMNAKEVCGGHGGQIPKNLTPEKAVTFVTFCVPFEKIEVFE